MTHSVKLYSSAKNGVVFGVTTSVVSFIRCLRRRNRPFRFITTPHTGVRNINGLSIKLRSSLRSGSLSCFYYAGGQVSSLNFTARARGLIMP